MCCSSPIWATTVAVAAPIAATLKELAHGLVAVRGLELASGLHRRSAHGLLTAAEYSVSDEFATAFAATSRAANAAKHASFLRPPRILGHALPSSLDSADSFPDFKSEEERGTVPIVTLSCRFRTTPAVT